MPWQDFESLAIPSVSKSWADYIHTCGRAELRKGVTEDHWEDLKVLLQYEKKDRQGGLTMQRNYNNAGLELKKGDRVIPCDDMPNVACVLEEKPEVAGTNQTNIEQQEKGAFSFLRAKPEATR
eukprot:203663-Amphidinium_carterae.1